MEMGERSKGKLPHASSYLSSRTDRLHHDGALAESYWKNHRESNQASSNWQRERRQSGGTDNPAATYYSSCDPLRKHKRYNVTPNSASSKYFSVHNSEMTYRCPQNHRFTRNNLSPTNAVAVIRKGISYKEEENEADVDDDDDDDVLANEVYFDDEVVDENDGEEGTPEWISAANLEEEQGDSCGSYGTNEKDRDDLEDEIDEEYSSPQFHQLRRKYKKDPSLVFERLKVLDQEQEKLKLQHLRRLQNQYQGQVSSRCNQDIPEHNETDDASDDGETIPASHPFSLRKPTKKSTAYHQKISLPPARNQDNYISMRSSSQSHRHSRRPESLKPSLTPFVETHAHKRTCSFCGGTGSYLSEKMAPRKTSGRLYDSGKAYFSTKDKFGVDAEAGDPGESCNSGRRDSLKSSFPNMEDMADGLPLSSLKPRRSRNARSPVRG